MMKFIKSTLIVSICTFISRVFGYIRDMVIAAKLGTSLLNDAFVAAFRLTNMFRNIFAEGALNLVFVPAFSQELKDKGKIKALEFASKIYSLLILILVSFCILVIIFMPEIIWYSTPGFRNNFEIYNLTVLFGRITFPYLFCISIAAFYGGILNSFEKFFPFAIAPAILNIVIIFILLFLDNFETTAHSLSIATLLGGLLELLWMAYFIFKNGYKLRFVKIEFNDKILRVLKNIVPVVISSGVTHVNTWVSMIILSFFPGGLSYIYYADRIVQLPLALIGTAIGTVLLPMLSKKAKFTDVNSTNNLQNHAINLVMMLTIPSVFGLFFLSDEIIYTLFERGEFSSKSTINTSSTLKILILGLPAFILIKLFQTKFYAKLNTKIPVIISIISIFSNILISISLMDHFKYLGVAIANVIAGWINIFMLMILSYKILNFRFQKYIYKEAAKYLLAAISMALIIGVFANIVDLYNKFLLLFFEVIIGVISYFSICYLLKIQIIKNFK